MQDIMCRINALGRRMTTDDLDRDCIDAVHQIRQQVEVIRHRIDLFDIKLSKFAPPPPKRPTTASKWPRTYR
jgi:hypothetical protein